MIAKDWGRIMVWNNYLTQPMGADATFVLGQPNKSTRDYNTWELGARAGHAIDNKSRLWTSDGHGKLMVFQLPLTASSEPLAQDIKLYWNDQRTTEVTSIDQYDGVTQRGYDARDITFDTINNKLWISDQNRLLRISNYDNYSGKLYVDMVIGQVSKSANTCNRGGSRAANVLCNASTIRFDTLGNLYAVENDYECRVEPYSGNNRISVFLANDIKNASGIFPNLSAKKVFNPTNPGMLNAPPGRCKNLTTDEPYSPVMIAFNSRNEMVIANDGEYVTNYEERPLKQLYFYSDPLNNQLPSAYIRLPMGVPGDIVFDKNNNLIIQDATWSRIWVINLDENPEWLVYPENDTTPPRVEIGLPTYADTYTETTSTMTVGVILSDNKSRPEEITATWKNMANGSSGQIYATPYGWFGLGIPLQPGDNKIVVTATDLAGNMASDTLNVVKEGIEVVYPNFRGILGYGTTTTIKWKSHRGDGHYKISLLDANKIPILTIASSTIDDGEELWLIPGPTTLPEGDYHWRFECLDCEYSDDTDRTFHIQDYVAPTIQVMYPTSTFPYTTQSSTVTLGMLIWDDLDPVTAITARWSSSANTTGTIGATYFGWFGQVPLVPGTNHIWIEALDSKFNQAISIITLNYVP